MKKTAKEIIEWVDEHEYYKYWYGGKRQKATTVLAQTLMDRNPDVWTQNYYRKALADITNGETVCDCSGFVCGAYGIPDIGSSQLPSYFCAWDKGTYIPGMIAWKKGHCGIIIDDKGHVAEMRGIDTDYCKSRTFAEAGFARILYSNVIDYTTTTDSLDHAIGWHGSGTACWYSPGGKKGDYLRDGFYMIRGHVYYFGHDGYSKIGVQYICDVPYAFGYDGLMISDVSTGAQLRYVEYGDLKKLSDIGCTIISTD